MSGRSVKCRRPQWIGLGSKRGGTCRVANPWPAAVLYEGARKISRQEERVVEFTIE